MINRSKASQGLQIIKLLFFYQTSTKNNLMWLRALFLTIRFDRHSLFLNDLIPKQYQYFTAVINHCILW